MNILFVIVSILLYFCSPSAAAYIFVNDLTLNTMAAAEAVCVANYNGHLAAIHSQADNDAVAAACLDVGQVQAACMIGIDYPNQVTTWPDLSTVDYTNWAGNEPDGGAAQPLINMRQDGLWWSVGAMNIPYVCEGTSQDPSASPSENPTEPTTAPSENPTEPTTAPSENPTGAPSKNPSMSPSDDPSISPSNDPSISPSNDPSISPSNHPSTPPSVHPSMSPSDNPSASPSVHPSASPSNNPVPATSNPSMSPSTAPTVPQYLVSTSTTRGTWQEAQSWCQSQGTTLASIHSTDDFNAAKARCKALIDVKLNSYGCWIGLNNIATQTEFIWTDGSTSDYGFTANDPSQPTDSTHPWYGGQTPSTADADACVIMQAGNRNYQWTVGACSTATYAYPICNAIPVATMEPSASPSDYPSASPTKAPTKKSCTKDVNYVIDGAICQVWGDPHFNPFSGSRGRHDFMGQPAATGQSQYYYVARCNGESVDDMPFTIIGQHTQLNSAVTGLEYVTLQLYDSDGTEYLAFFSGSIASYGTRDTTTPVSTLYADNEAAASVTLMDITAGADTSIGSRFSVLYTRSGTRIDVVLTIDGTCTVEFYMTGANPTQHTLYITPPECYKCFICGLCGDFKRSQSSGPLYMETCSGGFVNYAAGWAAGNAFAYDVNANTWAVDYCSRRRRLSGTDFVEYVPDVGDDFTYVDPCDASIAQTVVDSCQTARDAATTCCDLIGATFCDELQESCEFDACVASGTDTTVIDAKVAELFTGAVDLACIIPDVAGLFDESRIISDTVIDEYVFPTEMPSSSPTISTDAPTVTIIETVIETTKKEDIEPTGEGAASTVSMILAAIIGVLVLLVEQV